MTADLRWAREDEVPALEDLMREASPTWLPVDGVRRLRVRPVGETPTRFGPVIRMLRDLPP